MLGRVESTSLRQICEGHRWQGLSAKQRLLRWCSVPQWTDRALEQDDFEGVLSPMGIRWISP